MAKKTSKMRILILPVVAVFAVGFFASSDVFAEDEKFVIPKWVKDVAKYWHEGSIDDDTFIGTLKYLIQHEILILPETDTKSTESEIPAWVKNTAGWWADNKIGDEAFVNALQYLIEIGVIQVCTDQTCYAGSSGGGSGSGGSGGGGGGY
tara:strand:+ start:72 stop:521 length:450 start_codon:yes stop_codon:yes gene_type:complete